jgi:hypothetical protein
MFPFIEIFIESDVLKLYFHVLEVLFNPLFFNSYSLHRNQYSNLCYTGVTIEYAI